MIEKQNRYQEITVETANQLKKCFQEKKTNKIIYKEFTQLAANFFSECNRKKRSTTRA
jgi:hypothetical protein